MYTVDLYLRVRLACHVDGLSQREAASRFGIARETVRKMLRHSEPPEYRRRQPPKRPKLAPFTDIIDRILEEDRTVHRKQHHTAKRIFERLRDEHGFTGKETIVKDYVRERRLRRREMFVPLSHPPGHAQADFGEADAIIAGVKYRAHFFVMTLPHSDACFVAAYPAATTEAWLDGHNRAFVFFGGVPQSILYDNDKCLVSRILSYHRAECLTHVGDSQAVRSLTQCGEPMRFAMAAPIDLRSDFDSVSLRRLAKRTRDATQSRRLLALAEVYDGGSRTDASRIGGVGLQIIRDWVLRFNARGPDGLVDGKSPGAPSKLNADHRRALAEVVEAGPVPAVDGVVRWRRKDLARWLLETFAISLDETTVGRELKALGFAKISARPRHYAQNELAVEAFKKNFPAELAKIRARLPKGVEIELWWQDEARIGQKNKLTRRWARRGTRPRAPRDQRTEWAYIFGAICPAKGKGAGLVMPWCDTDAMAAHLIEISAAVDPGAHAVLIVDQAGWHLTPKLAIPDNITVLALPPRSPELNPVENVWQFMRDNWLSNRIFKSYEDIVALCCQAWNNLIDQPWKIMSLGMRKWAHGF